MRLGIIHGFVVGLLALASCKTAQVTKENQPLLSKVTTLEHKQKLYQSGYAMYGYDLADKWKLFMNPDSVVALISEDSNLRGMLYGKFNSSFPMDTEIVQLPNGMKITNLRKFCNDTALKVVTPYQLTIQKDSNIWSGCASAIYDTRINGKWRLTHIKGNLVPNAHTDKSPMIEIDGEQERLSGKLTCNRIAGPIYIRKNQLKTHQFAVTRMACADVVENIFVVVFKDLETYKVQNDTLIITNALGHDIQFERVK